MNLVKQHDTITLLNETQKQCLYAAQQIYEAIDCVLKGHKDSANSNIEDIISRIEDARIAIEKAYQNT